MRISAMVAGVCLAAALPVAAAALAPSAILAHPASFDGKAVTVTGTVANFQTNKTLIGTVAAFQLCDTKCLIVIDQKNTARHDGDTATVSGTFQIKFKGPQRSFTNVVVIK